MRKIVNIKADQAELQLRIKALHSLYRGTDPSRMCYSWYVDEVTRLVRKLHDLKGEEVEVQELGAVNMMESI